MHEDIHCSMACTCDTLETIYVLLHRRWERGWMNHARVYNTPHSLEQMEEAVCEQLGG